MFKAAAILGVTLLFATGARAADQSEIGLMAFAGYRGGGHFDAVSGPDNFSIESGESYGAALSWFASSDIRYRVVYDFQPTAIHGKGVDLDIEHLHLDGALPFNGTDKLVPYIAGGVGATRFRPKGYDAESDFSITLGLGLDGSLSKHAYYTFEARTYFTFTSGDSELFCTSTGGAGGCLVRASGNSLFEYELIGGIGVRF